MIRHTRGNAGKGTIRCPRCGLENVMSIWAPLAPGEHRVTHTCGGCGANMILDARRWKHWRQGDDPYADREPGEDGSE